MAQTHFKINVPFKKEETQRRVSISNDRRCPFKYTIHLKQWQWYVRTEHTWKRKETSGNEEIKRYPSSLEKGGSINIGL